jgi:hypothetical protein
VERVVLQTKKTLIISALHEDYSVVKDNENFEFDAVTFFVLALEATFGSSECHNVTCDCIVHMQQ